MFDEDVNETFVETPGNWTTSRSTVVLSVQRIMPNIARVTTATQIASGESLVLPHVPEQGIAVAVSVHLEANPRNRLKESEDDDDAVFISRLRQPPGWNCPTRGSHVRRK